MTEDVKGGAGSGNFGHAGRPGHVGGSTGGGHKLTYLPDADHVAAIQDNVMRKYDYLGTSREDVQGFLHELSTDGTLSIRVENKTLDKILDSGRLKTQFETGTSKGALSPEMRAEAEEAGLGVPQSVADSQRPVYGYVNYGDTIGRESQYGNVELRLKDEIKDRSTMTVGDSLLGFQNGDIAGTPMREPDIEGADFARSIASYLSGDVSYQDFVNDVGYIEAQIQGGVSVSDIEHVIVHSGFLSSYAEATLKKAGIGIFYDYQMLAEATGKSIKGGAGSGNFGHHGRPGHVGGSSSGSLIRPPQSRIDEIRDVHQNLLADFDKHAVANAHAILNDYAQNGEIMITVSMVAMDGILKDGRLKSSFETNSGAGTEQDREAAEEFGLGYPKSTPPEERPIYGILTKPGERGAESEYGGISVFIKNEVKDRSTMTLGDSYVGMVRERTVATPISKPDLEGIAMSSMVLSYIAGDSDAKDFRRRDYIETQIQGGVKLSDISRIEGARYLKPDKLAYLESFGIEIKGASAEVKEIDPDELAARLSTFEHSETVTEVLRRMLTESGSLGVTVASTELDDILIDFDWRGVHEQAINRALDYSYALISGITQTTKDHLALSIATWIETGESMELLYEMLSPIFGAARSELIASTEVTRAYADGTMTAYRESGVVDEMEWRTANDETTCDICRPLNGETSPLDSPSFGSDMLEQPPAHPRCRCFIAPVIHVPGAKGGPGSGNFGHVGRPGHRGGSAAGGGHARLAEQYGVSASRDDGRTVEWSPSMSRSDAEAWVRDSQVKTDSYHITSAWAAGEIESKGYTKGFDLSVFPKFGRAFGDGVYTTENDATAGMYQKMVGGKASKMVMKTKISKLLEVDMRDDPEMDHIDIISQAHNVPRAEAAKMLRGSRESGPGDFTKIIMDAGYDAIRIKAPSPTDVLSGGDQLVIFNPKAVVVVKD